MNIPPVSTVDNLLQLLKKKDEEKKLKEQQILSNKLRREKIRELKEKEQGIQKEF